MKKIITTFTLSLSLTLSISILFPVSSFAATNTIQTTIDHVEFDPSAHSYYTVSSNDGHGEWVLYLMNANKPNASLIDGLNATLKGHKMNIEYNDHEEANTDYWEVLDWNIVD